MNVNDFRSKIAGWRLAENLSQEDLDLECGFLLGTVARIEQEKVEMKNDQFLRILERTGRDLLSTLLEDCGILFRELLPLAQEIQSSGNDASAQGAWHDREFETALSGMLSGARVVISKVAKVSDERLWASDLLLRAASRASKAPARQRARKRRGKPPSEAQE